MNPFTKKLVFAILAVLAPVLIGLLSKKTVECNRQAASLDTLNKQVQALEQVAWDFKQRTDSLSSRLSALDLSPIYPADINRLRKRGLKDPVSDLKNDLQSHPEIIPYPGIHDSRMGFYDANRIRILSGSWVYASFDDGHIVGDAIFEYRVKPGGIISWRILRSRLDY